MMETILGFLVKAMGKLLMMLCNTFTDALSLDTSRHAELFPFTETATTLFKTIGLGLVLLIAAFQLAKFFFGPLSAVKESPVHILLRSAIAAGLVQSGDKILDVVIEMAKGPYSAMIGAVQGMPVLTRTVPNFAGIVTDAVAVLAGDAPIAMGVILLGGLILIISLAFDLVKLMVEICERYLMVDVLFYTSPLTFSTIASGQTSAIFQRWLSMFFGQCIVMTLSVWSFGIALSGISTLGTKNGGGFIFQMILIIAACRLGLRMDSYMQQIGVNTATTGGSLLNEIAGTAGIIGGLARMGRRSGQGPNRDGVLGGIKGSDGKVRPEAFGGGLFGAGVTAARYAKHAYKNGESAANIAKAAKEGAEKGFGLKDGALFTGRKIANAREARRAAQNPVTTAEAGTMRRSGNMQNAVLDDVAKGNGLKLNKDGSLGGSSQAAGQFIAANHDKSAAYNAAVSTIRGGDPAVSEQFLFGNHNDLQHRGPGTDNPSEISKKQHDALGASALESTFGSSLKDLHNAPAGTIGQKERDAMQLERGIKNATNTSNVGNSAVDFRARDFKGQPGMGRQVTGNLTDENGKRVSGFDILDQKAFDSLSAKEKGDYLELKSATGENYYTRSTPVGNADPDMPKAPYGADKAYPHDAVQMSGADAESKLFGNGPDNVAADNSAADITAAGGEQVPGGTADQASAANDSVEADQENAAAMGAMLSGSMQDAITAGGENSEQLQQYADAMQGAAEGDARHGYLSGVRSSPVDADDPSKGTQVTADLNDTSGTTVGSMRLLDQKAYDSLSGPDKSGYTELKSQSGQSYYMSMADVKSGSAATSGTVSGSMASGAAAAGGVAAGGAAVARTVGGGDPIHGGSVAVGGTAGAQPVGGGVVHSGSVPADGTAGAQPADSGAVHGGSVSVGGAAGEQPAGSGPVHSGSVPAGGTAGVQPAGSGPVHGGSVPAGGTAGARPAGGGTVHGGGTPIPASDISGSNVVVGAEAGGYGHRSYSDGPHAATTGTAQDSGELTASSWNGTPIPVDPILSEASYSFGAGICADGTDRVSIGTNGVFQSDDDEDLAQAVKEGFTAQAGVLTFHDAAAKTCQSMDGSQAAIMMYEAKTGDLPAGGKYDSAVATAMTRAYTPEAVESAMPIANSAASGSPVYGAGGSGSATPVETMSGEDAKQLYPAIQRAAGGDSTPDEQGRYCDNFGIQGGVSSFDYHTPEGTYHVQSMFSQTYGEMRDQGVFPEGSSAVQVFPNDVPTGGLAQFTMVTSKVPDSGEPTVLTAGGTAYVSTSMPSVVSGTVRQPDVTPVAAAPVDMPAPATVQVPVSTAAPAPSVVAQAPTVSASAQPVPQFAAPGGGKPAAPYAGTGHTASSGISLDADTSSDALITPENGQSRSKRKHRRRRNR